MSMPVCNRLLLDQLDHLLFNVVKTISPKDIYKHGNIPIPLDYVVDGFRELRFGDWYIDLDDYRIYQWKRQDMGHGYVALVVKRKKKKVIKFTEIRQDIITNRGEHYEHEMVMYYTYHNNSSHDKPVVVYKREETEE